MKGRYQKAEQKRVMPNGAAPYGFRCISAAQSAVMPEFKDRSGEYLVEEVEAGIVREMFTRYAAGSTLRGLETWLLEAGAKAPRGGMFQRSRIQSLLRNTAYVGRPTYAGRELACPALISEELFAAVQQRLDDNQERMRGRTTTVWPLRGCMTCGHCTTPSGAARSCVGMDPQRGRRVYVCTSRMTRGAFCGTKHLADDLENDVRAALRLAATPGRLAAMERARAEAALANVGDPEKQGRAARAELTKLDVEEEKLADLHLSGFSPAIIDKKLADIQARRKQAQDALSGATAAARKLEDPEQAAARAEAVAARLRDGLEDALADPVRFGELCRLLVRVRLLKDGKPVIDMEIPAVG